MSSLISVSTDTVPLHNGAEYWESQTSSLFGQLELRVRRSDGFHGQYDYAPISDLILCHLRSDAHLIRRTSSMARQTNHGGYLKALLQLRGTSRLEQDERTTTIQPGEWSLYDTGRPYQLSVGEKSEMLLLLLPREHLFLPHGSLRRLTARTINAQSGLGRLASELIRNSFDELEQLGNTSRPDVAAAIVQLVRQSVLNQSCEEHDDSSRDVLRERVKAYLCSHLRDPSLTIDQLAATFRCSKRYLHKVFEDEHCSITEYIQQKRLERCLEELTDPALEQSITTVAYSWGFNNSNHFGRRFKEAFGITPSAARDGVPARVNRIPTSRN